MHINNVNLSGSASEYKCNCCIGNVNLSNIWFDNSYAEITTTNCLNLNNHSWYLLVAGILLVIFIIILNVTVAQGTINGLIFYANIVWAYNEIFFPRYDQTQFDFFKMFIAWINLDFGIEVCFIKDLNAYWKTWFQFFFPIYINFVLLQE